MGLGMSKPCCEYDIMVLSKGNRPHEVMKLGSYWTELIYIPLKSKLMKIVPDSVEGIVLNDMDNLDATFNKKYRHE